MRRLAELVYEWTAYGAGDDLDRNGHLFFEAEGQPAVLVDPVALDPLDRHWIEARGGVSVIVLTGGDWQHRAREAAQQDRPILAPAPLVEQVASVVGPERVSAYGRESRLPAGLVVAPLHGAPPADVVLRHWRTDSVVAGGVLVGAPAGSLSLGSAVAGEPGGSQSAGVVRSLRGLLAHPVRRVLAGLGQSVLRDAEALLQDLVYRHDPAACILRPEELVWQPPRTRGSRFARQTGECSRLLGLKTLDFEVTTVPPGKQNTLLHRHDGAAEYPESNKVSQWAPYKARRYYLPRDTNVDYWEGERLD